jgi:hypothetical protein
MHSPDGSANTIGEALTGNVVAFVAMQGSTALPEMLLFAMLICHSHQMTVGPPDSLLRIILINSL